MRQPLPVRLDRFVVRLGTEKSRFQCCPRASTEASICRNRNLSTPSTNCDVMSPSMVSGCVPGNGSAPCANTPGSDSNAMQTQVWPEAHTQDFMRAITKYPITKLCVSKFGIRPRNHTLPAGSKTVVFRNPRKRLSSRDGQQICFAEQTTQAAHVRSHAGSAI